MRLSTDPDRDRERALRTIHAALEGGATLLDTADAYGLDEADRGHNERLIAEALRTWAGPGSRVTVATKGGLTRPGGRWVPDGRAKHLRAACEASLRALGRDRLDLYQLHAPDPRTPLATSVRALHRLREEGLVDRIGLCNVSLRQLREARRLAPIDAVQVALSPLDGSTLRTGVPEACLHGEPPTRLLGHGPLGGPRRARRALRDPVLVELASARGVSPARLLLAWWRDLGAVPLPGATRAESAADAVAAGALRLTAEERSALDARIAGARGLRRPRAQQRPAAGLTRGEVVLIVGLPGAGKSTRARSELRPGGVRLNRDEAGCTLRTLHRRLDAKLAGGAPQAVLDNTYGTRAQRSEVIEIAWAHRRSVRCVWMDTPIEQAQVNAVLRMLERAGRLLEPGELRRGSPDLFGPRVQFRHRDAFEPPEPDEGFDGIARVPFVRPPWPGERAAVVFSVEALAASAEAARDGLADERVERLLEHAGDRPLFATAWRPGQAPEDDAALEAGLRHRLRRPALRLLTCRHPAGPPVCWCRKPLPGLAVRLLLEEGIDPARSLWVGTGAADRRLAAVLGFRFVEPSV